MIILSARQLSKIYQANARSAPVNALQDVNFDVEEGEFVAIMGPSGCGKSTLLHLLGALDRPTAGEVMLRDKRFSRLNESQRAILRRREIGFVFQAFNLIGNLTVADNIELPALLAGMSRSDAARRRSELLNDLGIADKAQVIPTELSGGQRQRVALARALVNRPSVLLADEPTGNLDSASTAEVLGLLRRYHAVGQTIVMVTHDPHVASVAERIVTMQDGRIASDTGRAVHPATVTAADLVRAGGSGR